MARGEELPLYHKTYGLTKYLYEAVQNFPKEYKYSIGSDMISLAWECLDLVLEANAASNAGKSAVIRRLDGACEKLKLRVRMSQEIRLFSPGQFAHIQEQYLFEIGRMIGGWKQWAERLRS
ncbi:MAG: four helix bundle protein [Candidatus Moraniibacteriota bacterium]